MIGVKHAQFTEKCGNTNCPNTATVKAVKVRESETTGVRTTITLYACDECWLENENDVEGLLQ